MLQRTNVYLKLLLIAISILPAAAFGQNKQEKLAQNAIRVLNEIMRAPDKRVPTKMFDTAEAIAVIPDVIKAGLILGGRHGKGLLSVRARDGTWSNPTFIGLSGGSLGFQAGVQSTDVILIFRTPRGVDSIVNGKFTLGADASVAAGPVGRSATAATDAQLKAEIYSYSRARGLFAGVALDGSVISIEHDHNEKAYGKSATPRRIFEGNIERAPNQIVAFRDALEEYTAQ